MPFDFFRHKTRESKHPTQRALQVAEKELLPPLTEMELVHDLGSQVNALVPVQTRGQLQTLPNNTLTIYSRERAVPSISGVDLLHPYSGDRAMQVTFTDPTDSGCAVCQVAPTKTAAECIQALQSQGFLGPGSYHFVVNGQTMMPDQTLAQAGVADQATVVVYKMEQGASLRS